jgi:hypothetical protein
MKAELSKGLLDSLEEEDFESSLEEIRFIKESKILRCTQKQQNNYYFIDIDMECGKL